MQWALPELWPLLLVGGFVVGFLVGLTGVGAGSLTTPFLISVIGINPLTAVGTDLIFACITKASSAWRHHSLGNVNYPVLGWLTLGSLPGALLVFLAIWASGIDPKWLASMLRSALAIILVVSAAAIACYPLIAARLSRAGEIGGPDVAARPRVTVALGLLLGIAVALTSAGAGAIGVVALTAIYPALTMRRLVGTDIVHAIPLTLAAGLGHMGLGHLDIALLVTLLAGSVPGIAIGSRLTGILPDRVLRMALAAILCLAAYSLKMK